MPDQTSHRLRALARRSGLPRTLREAHLAALRLAGRTRNRHTKGTGSPSGRLRILADVPSYPTSTLAGSERSLHAVLAWLEGRGHEIAVAVPPGEVAGVLDGVPVDVVRTRRTLLERYDDSDVVLTQLGRRNAALRLAALADRPLVQFLRMGGADREAVFGTPDLVVFNACWLRERFPWRGPSIVVHPRVPADDYQVAPTGDSITLVGLSELKGAHTFYALARRLPRHSFLGIRGTWGDQIVPDHLPANVTVQGPTRDMRSVFRRTRVLLMPSSHETFGRVALEAAASGIPTIAHPNPGLVELLGAQGRYADRDDLDAWVRQLESVSTPDGWKHATADARQVFRRWDTEEELLSFERRLQLLTS